MKRMERMGPSPGRRFVVFALACGVLLAGTLAVLFAWGTRPAPERSATRENALVGPAPVRLAHPVHPAHPVDPARLARGGAEVEPVVRVSRSQRLAPRGSPPPVEAAPPREPPGPGMVISVREARVVDSHGNPVDDALVLVRPVGRRGSADRRGSAEVPKRTDSSGRIATPVRSGVRHEVLVWWPDREGIPRLDPDLRRVIAASSGVGALELPPEVPAEDRGGVVGVVVLPSGEPATDAFVRIWRDGQPEWTHRVEPDIEGRFLIEGIKPGAFRLEVHRDGHPTLHLKEIEVRAGIGLDLGVLRLPAAARIRVRVRVAGGGAGGSSVPIRILALDQRIEYNQREGLSEELAAGTYLVLAGSHGQVQQVEVREGEQLDLDVVPLPTGLARFEFVMEDGSSPLAIGFEVLDSADRRVYSGSTFASYPRLRLDLVPGDYRLRASQARGFAAEQAFSVREGQQGNPEKFLLLAPEAG